MIIVDFRLHILRFCVSVYYYRHYSMYKLQSHLQKAVVDKCSKMNYFMDNLL